MKKGMLNPIVTMLVFAVVLAVILFVFFLPGGLFAKLQTPGSFEVPGTGKEEVKEIPISKETAEVYQNLVAAFNEAKNSEFERCIVKMKQLPDFKNEIITIDKTEKGTMIKSLDKDGRVAKSTTIEGISPCGVVGKTQDNKIISRSFLFNFQDNLVKATPDYTEITSLTIKDKDHFYIGKEDYWLSDRDCCGAEKIILLYKPDKQHVCFIPTYGGAFWTKTCAGNENEGINDDCIAYLLPSINSKKTINNYNLEGEASVPLCSGKQSPEEVCADMPASCNDIKDERTCKAVNVLCNSCEFRNGKCVDKLGLN